MSYTGGHTDVYIPYGENIKHYDVNSLYPHSMLMNKLPIGTIIQFQGDIKWLYQLDERYIKENTYWIGDANVKTKN